MGFELSARMHGAWLERAWNPEKYRELRKEALAALDACKARHGDA